MRNFTTPHLSKQEKALCVSNNLFLMLFILFLSNAFSYSQCNTGAALGSSVYTPNYSGNEELVTLLSTDNGVYCKVNVLANRYYTFYTYVAGNFDLGYQDYITITDASGNFLDFGLSPLQYSSNNYSGEIRYYFHSNSACQTSTVNRSVWMMSSTSLCMPPANLNETNITSGSVTLNWQEQNPLPSNGYQYYVALADTSPPQPPTNNTASPVTGFTLNTSITVNIDANERYYWWVRSNCGSQQSVWIEGGYFDTPAVICNQPTAFTVNNITANSALFTWQAPSPLPSNGYNFALNTSGLNPSASYFPLSTSQFVTNLASNTTYYYFIRSNCNTQQLPWVFGGTFTTPVGINCNSATYGLNPTATYSPTCTGSPETIVSNAKAGEYANVAVQSNKQYTFASSIATDYITITNASGTVLYASGVTPLNWQSGSNVETIRFFLHSNSSCGNDQTYRSRTISCTPSASCAPPSNLSSYNIGTNIASISWTASSSNPPLYDVYFSTSNTAPNAATMPNGYIDAIAATINNLSVATTYYFWVRANCDDNQSAWIAGGSFTTTTAICNTPSNITKSNITSSSAQINWSAATPSPSSGYQFYYSTTNNAPINSTTPSGSATTNTTTLNSLNTATTYYIWVRSNCGASQSIWVSGGSFTTLSVVCNPPTNVSSTNVTIDSAQINWTLPTPAADLYDVYLSNSSTPPTSDTTPLGSVTGVPVDLINLTTDVTYYFWVRSNCGSSQSGWVFGGSFTTTPTGDCTNAVYGLFPAETFTPACSGSAETIATNSYAGEYTNVNILANNQYTFASSIATDYITITNATATVVYASGISPLVWSSGSNSGVIRYFFHTNSGCGSQNTDRIRYITCTSPVSCNPPTTLTASAIANTTATLNWNAPASTPSNGYQYYYNTSSTAPTAATTPSGMTAGTNASISSLTTNTTYYFWARSNCGTSQSAWASGGSFTTTGSANVCNAPTNLSVVHITASSARVNYTTASPTPAEGYEFYYSMQNIAPETSPEGTLSSSRLLTGLSGSTTYYYWVRSDCGSLKSAWVFGGSFVTPPFYNCSGAIYGINPLTAFTPSCTGVPEVITNYSWAGHFSEVNIVANKQYTFTSSVATDYITITNATGSVLYGSGTSPLVWISGTNSGLLRYFTHSNNSCGDQSTSRIKSVTCATILGNEILLADTFQLFPNPTTGIVNFSYPNVIDKIEVTNMLGQRILEKNINGDQGNFDLSVFASGTYFVKVFSAAQHKVFRVIKQ
ncbi:MAG: fibronectin type III domain-containing protein [Flavobacterium sp.]|nr:fibronectin type III domain-containing protein [Flavobacterium sp.]